MKPTPMQRANEWLEGWPQLKDADRVAMATTLALLLEDAIDEGREQVLERVRVMIARRRAA
jgi:hypothetical protein